MKSVRSTALGGALLVVTTLGAPPIEAAPNQPSTAPSLRRPAASPHARIRPRPTRRMPARVKEPLYTEPCAGLEAVERGRTAPFSIGEELGYELSVSGAYVGRMELKVGRPRRVDGKEHLTLFGRARSTAFVATALKSFAGRYMALVDPASLRPRGARVESTYGKEDRWEKVRFQPNHRGVTADYLLRGKEDARSYAKQEHALTDMLTLLYVARTVTLQPGLEVCQDVYGSRRLWRMKAKVEGRTAVDTPVGVQPAWRIRTFFDRKPTPGLRSKNRPRLDMEVLLAEDEAQTPLKFTVQANGITAEARLVRWAVNGSKTEETWEF